MKLKMVSNHLFFRHILDYNYEVCRGHNHGSDFADC